jgi:accessory colonization factor AcfD
MLERAFYDQTLLVDTTQFPGKVDAGDTISVDLYLQKISRYSKWYARNMQSTGLFAPAHQEITVTAPSGVDLSKLQLIIGVGDNVSGLIKHELKLKRPPRMVKKYNFNSQTITVKHPYGGLIYVVSNDRNPDSEVGTFTFTNVEKAVYFKLGETDSTAWDTIKNYEAPKAELETEHFILTVARNNLANHSFDEVVQIAREYDEMTINAYDFYGFDRNCSENIDDFNIHTPPTCETRKGYKNREVFDPHISIGAGHSGYPIMIMNWRPNSNKFPQDATNSWLLWHEFGHNTAKKWLNIAGSIEVANNVMALYQQVKFNRPLRTDARMPNVDIIVDNPQSYGSSGAFGRLLMFAQLPLWIEANYLNEFKTANSKYYESNGTAKSEFKFLDESGWDFYKILHREARENNTSSGYRYKSCAENSDLTKVDSLALCSSSILNLDLTEFFDKWEAGTVGIGAVDGVNIYDSSSGFTQNGKNAISDLSLSSPDSDIHYFTGE